MWYHPTPTEYHKWITVKKSKLKPHRLDSTAGYGVFADRRFKENDYVGAYLGEYAKEGEENDYSLLQRKTNKRILVQAGFPKYKKMYLGAHMVNDHNWGKDVLQHDNKAYNVVFHPNLAMVALKDIEVGEELYVNYNYSGGALI